MKIGTVEPEAVSVAVPVTTQLVLRPASPFQKIVSVCVALVPSAVKKMKPDTLDGTPSHVSVKLRSTS
jgi:hypothetical protein